MVSEMTDETNQAKGGILFDLLFRISLNFLL